MKKLILAIVVMLCLVRNSFATTVAYWELDGGSWDGRDAVGTYDLSLTTQAFDAATIGAVANPDISTPWKGVNDATANPKATWLSSGSLSAYYLPNPVATHDSTFDFDSTKSFTIEGWYKPSASGWLIGNRTWNSDHAFGGSGKGWNLQVEGGGTSLVFVIDGAADNHTQFVSVPVVKNSFQHFAAVWDAADYQMRLYVNGVIAGALLGDAAWSGNRGGQLSIGARDLGAGYVSNNFNGPVDEFRIVDEALEPQYFLNGTTPVPEPTSLVLLLGGFGSAYYKRKGWLKK